MGTSFFVSGSVIALRSSLLKGCMSYATAAAKSLQLCPTLCHPINSSPLGSPIPGILQASILEWIAIAFSRMSYAPGQLHYYIYPTGARGQDRVLSTVLQEGHIWTSFPVSRAWRGPLAMGATAHYSSWPCSVLPVLFKTILQDKVFICILIFIYIWLFGCAGCLSLQASFL